MQSMINDAYNVIFDDLGSNSRCTWELHRNGEIDVYWDGEYVGFTYRTFGSGEWVAVTSLPFDGNYRCDYHTNSYDQRQGMPRRIIDTSWNHPLAGPAIRRIAMIWTKHRVLAESKLRRTR